MVKTIHYVFRRHANVVKDATGRSTNELAPGSLERITALGKSIEVPNGGIAGDHSTQPRSAATLVPLLQTAGVNEPQIGAYDNLDPLRWNPASMARALQYGESQGTAWTGSVDYIMQRPSSQGRWVDIGDRKEYEGLDQADELFFHAGVRVLQHLYDEFQRFAHRQQDDTTMRIECVTHSPTAEAALVELYCDGGARQLPSSIREL